MLRCERTEKLAITGLGRFTACSRFTDDKDKERKMRKNDQNETRAGGLGDLFDIGYGGEFSPGYGALVGLALAEIGTLGARKMGTGKVRQYAYAVGAGAGLAGAGVMYALGHKRAAMLGGAVALGVAVAEMVRTHYVKDLNGLGYYDAGIADGPIEFLGDADAEMAGALGAESPIEMLGQSSPPALAATPADVMGMYQPEMQGYQPYSGTF